MSQTYVISESPYLSRRANETHGEILLSSEGLSREDEENCLARGLEETRELEETEIE